MSEQRRWAIHACEEHGHQDCAVSHGALDVIVVVALSDLEAAERRVEDMLDLLQWVYSETTDRNIRDRLRSALSTTEEPAWPA